jgi:hypothetical protein
MAVAGRKRREVMKISEFIKFLEDIQEQHGNLDLMFNHGGELAAPREPMLGIIKPAGLPVVCLNLTEATPKAKTAKNPREEDVKFFAQVLLLAFYEGKRNGEPGGGRRNFSSDELEKIKSEWPVYEELARFYLSQLQGPG